MRMVEEIEFNTNAAIGQFIDVRRRGIRGVELCIVTNNAGVLSLGASDGVVTSNLLVVGPGGQNAGDTEYVRFPVWSEQLVLNWLGAGLKQMTMRLWDEPLLPDGRLTVWSKRYAALGAGASTGDVGPDNWGSMIKHWELLLASDQAVSAMFSPVVGSVWSGKYILNPGITAGTVFGTGPVPAVTGVAFDITNPAGVAAVVEVAVIGYLG